MITIVALGNAYKLIDHSIVDHVKVTCDSTGNPEALFWPFSTSDQGLNAMARRRDGVWDRNACAWTFPDSARAVQMLNAIVKRNPKWPIIGLPDKPFLPLKRISIFRLPLSADLEACVIPTPMPVFTEITETAKVFRLDDGKKKGGLGILIGSTKEIDIAINSLVQQGARCNDTLANKWLITRAPNSKLQIRVTGWAVEITCDLLNPHHYLLAPQYSRWERQYCYSDVSWDGVIHTTRKRWPELKASILAAGLNYEGDDPDADLRLPTTFDVSRVAGWSTPAPNGQLMYEYQKEGAMFCVKRRMRALIGDEMGVGKTVQAIAAAEACATQRILVVCPASARYVWEREIVGWGGTRVNSTHHESVGHT